MRMSTACSVHSCRVAFVSDSFLVRAFAPGVGISMKWPPWGPTTRTPRGFNYFGRGAALMAPQGVIYNERYLSIGDETLIGPNVASHGGHQRRTEMLAVPPVVHWTRCIIGRGSHIIGHWSIVLGDEIQTGPYVYITDENHSYEEIDQPVGWQTPSEGAVRIGSGSWLGANVVILPGTVLGQEHHRRGGSGGAWHVSRPRRAGRRAGQSPAPLQRRGDGWQSGPPSG
jgi:hypothetical protein